MPNAFIRIISGTNKPDLWCLFSEDLWWIADLDKNRWIWIWFLPYLMHSEQVVQFRADFYIYIYIRRSKNPNAPKNLWATQNIEYKFDRLLHPKRAPQIYMYINYMYMLIKVQSWISVPLQSEVSWARLDSGACGMCEDLSALMPAERRSVELY